MRTDVLAICSHTKTPQEMVAEANAPNMLRLPIYSCLLSKRVSSPKEKEERLYKVLEVKNHMYTTNYFLVTLDEVYTLLEMMDGEFVVGKREAPKIIKKEKDYIEDYAEEEDEEEENEEEEEEEYDSDGELVVKPKIIEDENTVGYISCDYNSFYKSSELISSLKTPKYQYALSKKVKNPTAKLALLDKKLKSEYKYHPYSKNEYTLSVDDARKLFDLFDGEMVVGGSA